MRFLTLEKPLQSAVIITVAKDIHCIVSHSKRKMQHQPWTKVLLRKLWDPAPYTKEPICQGTHPCIGKKADRTQFWA